MGSSQQTTDLWDEPYNSSFDNEVCAYALNQHALPIRKSEEGASIFNLMEAMLLRAQQDLVRAASLAPFFPRGRFPDALTAVAWVFNDADDYIFSFIRVCEELGLNVNAVRRQWRDAGLFGWDVARPDLVVLTSRGFLRHYKKKPSKMSQFCRAA